MKTSDLITLGVGAGILYALYKFVKGPAAAAVDSTASAIAAPIAAVSNWFYGSVNMTPSGLVILPNGQQVQMANAALGSIYFDSATNTAHFVYNGIPYVIQANPSGGPAYDQNGNYHAEYAQ
jgi:hypothetical protein